MVNVRIDVVAALLFAVGGLICSILTLVGGRPSLTSLFLIKLEVPSAGPGILSFVLKSMYFSAWDVCYQTTVGDDIQCVSNDNLSNLLTEILNIKNRLPPIIGNIVPPSLTDGVTQFQTIVNIWRDYESLFKNAVICSVVFASITLATIIMGLKFHRVFGYGVIFPLVTAVIAFVIVGEAGSVTSQMEDFLSDYPLLFGGIVVSTAGGVTVAAICGALMLAALIVMIIIRVWEGKRRQAAKTVNAGETEMASADQEKGISNGATVEETVQKE